MLLSIETATKVCSVSIHQEGKLIALSELHQEKSHSGQLTVLIDEILKNTSVDKNDLNGIIISKGPGSYTGLRIGTSTAKGLCFALGIPLISVNTLKAMAYEMTSVLEEDYYLCPMLDARRMEVYCLVTDHKSHVLQDTKAEVINERSFLDYLEEKKMLFFGNGSIKCKQVIRHKNAVFINNIYPSAKNIGYLGYKKFTEGAFEDMAYFEPYYLKDFQKGPAKK